MYIVTGTYTTLRALFFSHRMCLENQARPSTMPWEHLTGPDLPLVNTLLMCTYCHKYTYNIYMYVCLLYVQCIFSCGVGCSGSSGTGKKGYGWSNQVRTREKDVWSAYYTGTCIYQQQHRQNLLFVFLVLSIHLSVISMPSSIAQPQSQLLVQVYMYRCALTWTMNIIQVYTCRTYWAVLYYDRIGYILCSLAVVSSSVSDAGRHGHRNRGISTAGVQRSLGGRPGPEEHLLCFCCQGSCLRCGKQSSCRCCSGMVWSVVWVW